MANFSNLAYPGALQPMLAALPVHSKAALTHISGPKAVSSITFSELRHILMKVSLLLSELQAVVGSSPLIIALCMDVGIPAIAFILAIMNENAYLYIDPSMRGLQAMTRIITVVKPHYVIVDELYCDQCEWSQNKEQSKVISIFGNKFHIIYLNKLSSNCFLEPSDLCYVITTTGTTGMPKIVYVPRACVAPNVSDLSRIFELDNSDVVFSAAPLSFDPSIVNILMSLSAGAEVVVASSMALSSASVISHLLQRGVSVIQATPSLLALWNTQRALNCNLFGAASPVRLLALGGEHLPLTGVLGHWLLNAPHVRVFSLYGITEVSSWSSIKEVILNKSHTDGDCVQLDVPCTEKAGSGLLNTYTGNVIVNSKDSVNDRCDLYESMLDRYDLGEVMSETVMCVVKYGQVISDGQGEIFIGRVNNCVVLDCIAENTSEGVAQATTTERSVQSEGVPYRQQMSSLEYGGVVLVSSGDFGFICNNKIYYRGRKDNIVKIYGKKVNLVDVRSSCFEIPHVNACHVLYYNQHLVCFVVFSSDPEATAQKNKTKKILHIIGFPCKVYILKKLPINAHGKVDEAGLMRFLRVAGSESTAVVTASACDAGSESTAVVTASACDAGSESTVMVTASACDAGSESTAVVTASACDAGSESTAVVTASVCDAGSESTAVVTASVCDAGSESTAVVTASACDAGSESTAVVTASVCDAGSESTAVVTASVCDAGSESTAVVTASVCDAGSESTAMVTASACDAGSESTVVVTASVCDAGSESTAVVTASVCDAGSESTAVVTASVCDAGSESTAMVTASACDAGSESTVVVTASACDTGSESTAVVTASACDAGSKSTAVVTTSACDAGSESTAVVTASACDAVLRDVWEAVLRCPPAPDSNFVKQGGTSLQAVCLLEELEQRLCSSVTLALDVLLNRTYLEFKQCVTECVSFLHSSSYFENKGAKRKFSDNEFADFFSLTKRNKTRKENGNKDFVEIIIFRSRFLEKGVIKSYCEQHMPSKATLVWSHSLDKCIDASPLLTCTDGRSLLYVGAHSGQFCCLDAVTGAVRWTTCLEDRTEASPGVNASASRVYAGCYAGCLYCLDALRGTVLWKFKAGGEIKCSPLVDYDTGNIYFGSHDKWFYCLKEDGSLLWRQCPSGGSIYSSPCIFDDFVCCACLKGVITCYHKLTGSLRWQYFVQLPVFSSLVCFSRGILTASVNKCIYALSFSGGLLWRYETAAQCYCTPAVLRMEGSSGSEGLELIAIGTNSGALLVLSGCGRLISNYKTGGRICATPYLYRLEACTQQRCCSVACLVATSAGDLLFIELLLNNDWRRSLEKGIVSPGAVCEQLPSNEIKKRTNHVNLPPLWDSCVAYKIMYEGEIFSSPIIFRERLYVCGRNNKVTCFSLIK